MTQFQTSYFSEFVDSYFRSETRYGVVCYTILMVLFVYVRDIFITLRCIYATYSFCQVGLHIDRRGEYNILWDRYIIEIALSDAMSQPIV